MYLLYLYLVRIVSRRRPACGA